MQTCIGRYGGRPENQSGPRLTPDTELKVQRIGERHLLIPNLTAHRRSVGARHRLGLAFELHRLWAGYIDD
jgi:hypothetical protein